MLVSKISWLVSVKYWLKTTNVEISLNQYLTGTIDTNGYLINI